MEVDVGGNSTDAVAFCGSSVKAAAMVPTNHSDYVSFVVQVLSLLEQPLRFRSYCHGVIVWSIGSCYCAIARFSTTLPS